MKRQGMWAPLPLNFLGVGAALKEFNLLGYEDEAVESEFWDKYAAAGVTFISIVEPTKIEDRVEVVFPLIWSA